MFIYQFLAPAMCENIKSFPSWNGRVRKGSGDKKRFHDGSRNDVSPKQSFPKTTFPLNKQHFPQMTFPQNRWNNFSQNNVSPHDDWWPRSQPPAKVVWGFAKVKDGLG
jgi:hypothetical protein